MTLFGLDTPWSLFARDNETMRGQGEKRFIQGMNQWLAEPLEECLAVARDSSLCIESKSPVDIEEALGLYPRKHLPERADISPSPRHEERPASGASRRNSKMSFSAARAHSAAAQ